MTEDTNGVKKSENPGKAPWAGHVESIKIASYRKFRDIEITFKPGLNIIGGANGTGKSSILYLVSNSFQRPTKKMPWMADVTRNQLLTGFTGHLNQKVYKLIKNSKYNDPSAGFKGTLFTVCYEGDIAFDYRRHNSDKTNRHRLIPYYGNSQSVGLPAVPVIYLGLSRLSAPGEIDDEETFKKQKNLSEEAMEDLKNAYKKIARLELLDTETGSWGGGKLSGSFDTTKEGVDSNTISAGQDNVFVILYAFQTLVEYSKQTDGKPAVLLIDEFDATLHPAIQRELMDYLRASAVEHNVRVIFTSHSFNVLENGLEAKDHVLYFKTLAGGDVQLDPEPSMTSFRMDLSTLTMDALLKSNEIFVLMEDDEAREIFRILTRSLSDVDPLFAQISNRFKLIDIKMGESSLRQLFEVRDLWAETPAFAVLDGDQKGKTKLANKTMVLPGGDSPEKLLIEYGKVIQADVPSYWDSRPMSLEGYSYATFEKFVIDYINQKKRDATDKKPREIYKEAWKNFERGFQMLARAWVADPRNRSEVIAFFNDLEKMIMRNSSLIGLASSTWRFDPSLLDQLKPADD
ncbi:AAA family ATPase [Corynebacterium coyleae]|uniref:AAA family ATPase n=1 Tax=Corynebacterium coyleae TaxID=53374 RepID=UPI00254DC04E|nr:AAA family ATPase [Corynebacterium coyleae]MDK8823441.1 AAA family ATPase [Corynebacterium coyleae]